MPNLVGQDLGRYHITEQLGEGGMATVYKAFDARLERNVALKIIRADMGDDGGDMLKRFEREAKALAQLTHPNIVHIDDYGEQGGMPYVVMDYLPGGTLKQKLGRPMPYDEAARLLAPIARALEYAHQQKIIHRDVKPANILLTQSGAPMLTDFGIAKILESKDHTELTGTGVGLGTPDYMAPEQWFGKAEARTDIYALGIVFYELVTGRRPFSADTPAAVLIKHVNDPLPDPRQFVGDLPGRVEQVLLKALAKNVEDRYQTMGEFAAALERLAAARPSDHAAMPVQEPAAATVLVSPAAAPGTGGQRLAQSQAVPRPQPQSQPSVAVQRPTRAPIPPATVLAPAPAATVLVPAAAGPATSAQRMSQSQAVPIGAYETMLAGQAAVEPVVAPRSGKTRKVLIGGAVAGLVVLCLAGSAAAAFAVVSQMKPTATLTPSPVPATSTFTPSPTPVPPSATATTADTPTATYTLTPTDTTTASLTPSTTRTKTRVPPTRTWTPVPPTWTFTPPPPTPTNPPAPIIPTATPLVLHITLVPIPPIHLTLIPPIHILPPKL